MDLRIFTEPQQGASYDDQLAVAQTAEQLGFDAFFRSDHYLRMGPGDGLPGPTDSWVTLAGIARETSTIRLGTLVSSATFRWPGLLAISVAQVDAMSSGRVELGLGTGWYDAEHAAYGIEFPPLGKRFERLEEQLAIVSGLWSTPVGERFSFEGRHYKVSDSPALPKPVQSPHPPLILGGGGQKRTPRLAARYATEFNVPPTPHNPETVSAIFGRVRQACEAQQRDPATLLLSMASTTVCGADEAEFVRRAEAIGRSPEQLRESGLGGTPAEIIERLEAYRAVGVQRAYLQVMDMNDLDHIRLLGEEVLPAVRRA
jgi:F420-dependent oxidoreductase-like protein